jgi:uncharacterized protein YchJ
MKAWRVKDSVGNMMTCHAETKSGARRWYKNTGIRGTITSIECLGETQVKQKDIRKFDLVKDPMIRNIIHEQDDTMKQVHEHNKAATTGGRKVGPNENCKCGSGRKNKHCCKNKRT